MLGGRPSVKSQSLKPKSQKQPAAASVTAPAPQTKPLKAVKQSASIKAPSIKSESVKSEKPVKKQTPPTIQQPAATSEATPAVAAPKSAKPAKSTKTNTKSTPAKAPQQPKPEVITEAVSMDESTDHQPDIDMKPTSKPRESRAAKRTRTKVAPPVVDAEMDSEAAEVDEVDERGVVYLGRLPHGMFEKQLRTFLVQFGEIKHVKLSRNKKTGKSKHYAFVEFEHAGVANVVADAMHRYMMYGHTLEAHVVPADKLHPELFKDADKGFRHIPYAKIARAQYNQPRSTEQQQDRISGLLMKEDAKRRALKAAGIDFNFAGYRAELTPAV